MEQRGISAERYEAMAAEARRLARKMTAPENVRVLLRQALDFEARAIAVRQNGSKILHQQSHKF